MRIALTYNEKRGDGEEEAEFDSLDTIHAIARLLASLGHVVRPVEVSGPVERVVAQLRLIGPELVFNLAEGNRGRRTAGRAGAGIVQEAAGGWIRDHHRIAGGRRRRLFRCRLS